MAILKPNPSIGKPSGSVGELVYAHYPGGRVVIRRKPGPETRQTPAEQAAQNRFREAVRYRGRVTADPQQLAPYKTAARIRRKRACDLALADFLKGPGIFDIDASQYTGHAAERIVIGADDDFEVTAVEVRIRRLDGALVEEGRAVRDPENERRWIYTAQAEADPGQTVALEVTASDRAGNVARKRVDHALAG